MRKQFLFRKAVRVTCLQNRLPQFLEKLRGRRQRPGQNRQRRSLPIHYS